MVTFSPVSDFIGNDPRQQAVINVLIDSFHQQSSPLLLVTPLVTPQLKNLERLRLLTLIKAGYTIATCSVENISSFIDTAEQQKEARRMALCRP